MFPTFRFGVLLLLVQFSFWILCFCTLDLKNVNKLKVILNKAIKLDFENLICVQKKGKALQTAKMNTKEHLFKEIIEA